MRPSLRLLKGDLVLVTGANGFLGSSVVHAFRAAGFRVRGAVRSQAKADAWQRRHPSIEVEWEVVPDITAAGAFTQAVQDCRYVAHTASPVNYALRDNEKEVLQPAIKGVERLLEASAVEKSVERVVLTSSTAAVIGTQDLPAVGRTYTEKDWQPTMYEEAVRSKSSVFAYQASKKFAEQAAWRFMKERKPKFALTTLCPPMIYGPPLQPIESMDALNVSVQDIWALVDAKQLPLNTIYPICVDLRDIAELHVRACTHPAAVNQRYLCVGHHYTFSQMAEAIRTDPELSEKQRARIPSQPKERERPHFATDSSKVEELGVQWTPFVQTVRDTARELFRIEEQLMQRSK